ncbi:translation initiation factor IF-3 [Candidatus Saganbacteria bacterium]|uniref:Translation initiation factor IF-3 n=1 Tax=Candidatus Saganbacteria bacterium TaxID=2575572 RepID=A0A9D6YW02_UNCSA|nr:translation initiation factor IF-3 [Candidatus Saganbacteria bacterium]
MINERIWAKEVRLIDEEGKQLGVIPTFEALRAARERGCDLVLIAPAAKPPVARLADYGKFKYELTKKEKEARKTSKSGIIKEVKLSSKIARHDFEVRVEKANELLTKGYKVKVNLMFRGREMTHVDLGRAVLNRMIEATVNAGTPEATPKMEGRSLNLILVPK